VSQWKRKRVEEIFGWLVGAPCQGAEKGTRSIGGGRSKSSAWSPRHFCDGDRLRFFVRRGAMALVLRRSLRDVQVLGVGACRGHGEEADALGGPRFHASAHFGDRGQSDRAIVITSIGGS
jgi:hypothetical protein